MRMGGIAIDHTDHPVLGAHGHTEHGDKAFLFGQLLFFIERVLEDIENGHRPIMKGDMADDPFPEVQVPLLKIFFADALGRFYFQFLILPIKDPERTYR
jgi:hypothetical protein